MPSPGSFTPPPPPFGMGFGSSGMNGGVPDPSQMATMMQNPMMRQMMEQMLSDPNFIQQVYIYYLFIILI
jgi:hypothetical protein